MKKIFTILILFLYGTMFSQTLNENFETISKNGYAVADVTLNGVVWSASAALAGTSSSDWKFGAKSLRMAGVNNTSGVSNSFFEMKSNKVGGIGNITFFYRQYGSDATQIPWSIEWSSNGTTWTKLDEITATSSVKFYSKNLNEPNARIRIIANGFTTGTTSKRMNIDELVITDNGVPAPVNYYTYSNNLTFNKVIVNESSSKKILVFAPNNTSTLSASISGTDSALFNVSITNSSTTEALIDVTYNPNAIASNSATLTISNGSTSKDIPLTGTGIDSVNPYGLSESSPVSSFFDDFESSTANSVVAGSWTNFVQDDNYSWQVKSLTTTPVTLAAQMTAFGGNGYYKSLLISPAIDIDQISKSNVKFDWAGTFVTGSTLKVYLFKLVNGQPMQKNLLKTITTGETTGQVIFTNEVLDFSSYNGVGFLAFEYMGNTVENITSTYQIDNISISSSLAVGDVTKSKINLVKNTVVKDVLTFGAKANVKVVNFNGQVVKSVSVENGTTLDVSSLAKGVYLIKGDVNGETVVQKIIKQ